MLEHRSLNASSPVQFGPRRRPRPVVNHRHEPSQAGRCQGIGVAAVLERRHRRANSRVLHDGVLDGHAHRVQPEHAKGVPGEPSASGRDVQGAGDEEHDRIFGRRGSRPRAGHRHDEVADVRAKRAAVRAYAVGGRLERPDPEARPVHDVAALRRTGPERGPTAVRLLLLSAAHGGGRHRRNDTAGPDWRPNPDDHDRLQLHW